MPCTKVRRLLYNLGTRWTILYYAMHLYVYLIIFDCMVVDTNLAQTALLAILCFL
jgi:hypothetical protein